MARCCSQSSRYSWESPFSSTEEVFNDWSLSHQAIGCSDDDGSLYTQIMPFRNDYVRGLQWSHLIHISTNHVLRCYSQLSELKPVDFDEALVACVESKAQHSHC
jgi:hypothetical protein